MVELTHAEVVDISSLNGVPLLSLLVKRWIAVFGFEIKSDFISLCTVTPFPGSQKIQTCCHRRDLRYLQCQQFSNWASKTKKKGSDYFSRGFFDFPQRQDLKRLEGHWVTVCFCFFRRLKDKKSFQRFLKLSSILHRWTGFSHCFLAWKHLSEKVSSGEQNIRRSSEPLADPNPGGCQKLWKVTK